MVVQYVHVTRLYFIIMWEMKMGNTLWISGTSAAAEVQYLATHSGSKVTNVSKWSRRAELRRSSDYGPL